MRQAGHEAAANRVDPDPYDRYRAGGCADCQRHRAGNGNDDIRIAAGDFTSEIGIARGPAPAGIRLDDQVVPLGIAEPAKFLPERLPVTTCPVVDLGDRACRDHDRNAALLCRLLGTHCSDSAREL